ncbi:MAG TPA: hypothetical protein VK487_06660 [Candidatus Bathyarchaeia archaeon]|nr:hypothetical protein [Candidatus Bathyarchaeia archaeon]
MSVALPCISLAFGAVALPQSDVVSAHVYLGCTKEVSSFEVKLLNYGNKYGPQGGTYPITCGLNGHISMGRGANCPLLLTGIVTKTQCQTLAGYESDSGAEEDYLIVDGLCWGEQLSRKLVSASFENMKGEAIVEELINDWTSLGHVRNGVDLIQSTSDTFDLLKYANSSITDILNYLASCCDLNGVIGYEYRVEQDGLFSFFPIGAMPNSINLNGVFEHSEYNEDISQVLNMISVFGVASKPNVASMNFGTNESTPYIGSTVNAQSNAGQNNLYVSAPTNFSGGQKIFIYNYPNFEENSVASVQSTYIVCGSALQNTYMSPAAVIVFANSSGAQSQGWGPIYSSPTITANSSIVFTGNYSVQVSGPGGAPGTGVIFYWGKANPISMFTFPFINLNICTTVAAGVFVAFYDQSFNTVGQYFEEVMNDGNFHQIQLQGGPASATDGWTPGTGGWNGSPNFDWSNIIAIMIIMMTTSGVTFCIDGMYFGGAMYSGSSAGSASIATYGERDYSETDDQLLTDAACNFRAQALVNYYQSLAKSFTLKTTVLDYGTDIIQGGDTITLNLPNIGISNGSYRVDSCEYYIDQTLKDPCLEVTLSVGKVSPLLADYMMALRGVKGYGSVEKLNRTKQPRLVH